MITTPMKSLVGLLLVPLVRSAIIDGDAACSALQNSLQLENTTIIDVAYVTANSVVTTAGSCQSSANVTSSICRIYAQVNTTDTSSVKFEMWLPDEWYGRFIIVGNGGLGGCIDYSNLDYASSFHFASIGSDNGHDGDTGVHFLNQPEIINDFAWRAIHVSTELGKSIAQQYYNTSASKSYYMGCSTGGRQGMQSALKFPGDFDGILAGAPAVDFNHLLAFGGHCGRAVGAPDGTTNASFVPDELWPVVSTAILDQCDMLDGVADGIITEPDDCDFDPSVLLCGTGTGNATSSCLTEEQVEALGIIYTPLMGTSTNEEIYPRFDPGAEASTQRPLYFNGSIFSYTHDWWQNVIYNDTNYTFNDWGVGDIEYADEINPGGVATWDGNFSAYRERGGKILTYHGRFDGLIASGNSKRLHNLISSTLTPSNLDDFYRLFFVPGMAHCTGGPGCFNLGQRGDSIAVASNDSAHNALLALVNWVEGGVAPESIIGTSSNGTVREHCRWPEFDSQWNGTEWVCAATT